MSDSAVVKALSEEARSELCNYKITYFAFVEAKGERFPVEGLRFNGDTHFNWPLLLQRLGIENPTAELERDIIDELLSEGNKSWPYMAVSWFLMKKFRSSDKIQLDEQQALLEELLMSLAYYPCWRDERLKEAVYLITLDRSKSSFSDVAEILDRHCFNKDEVLTLMRKFAARSFEIKRMAMQQKSAPISAFLPLATELVSVFRGNGWYDDELLDLPSRQLITWKISKFLRGQTALLEFNDHQEFGGLNNLLQWASYNWINQSLPAYVERECLASLSRGYVKRVEFLLLALTKYHFSEKCCSIESLFPPAARIAENEFGRYDIASELWLRAREVEEYKRTKALADLYAQSEGLNLSCRAAD